MRMDSIDVVYDVVQLNSRQKVLQKYSNSLKQLRNYAEKTYQLRPYIFDNYMLVEYFQDDDNVNSSSSSSSINSTNTKVDGWIAFLKIELLNHILYRRKQILHALFYLLLVVFCVFVYRYETSSGAAERSVRSMVYPGMRLWRRLTLPLIQRFPRLTELYDESCLMGNPFFQVDGLSCAPCAQVDAVLDLKNGQRINNDTDYMEIMQQSKSVYVPFIFKMQEKPIKLQDFYKIYASNRKIFQRDAFRVQSTMHDITNLEQLFYNFNRTEFVRSHNLWRCNRMQPARLLRQLIARPSILPSSVALERFVAVDTPNAPSYTLPETECPHIYIQQALGSRFIILRPTSECRHHCRTLSIRLSQSVVLSYNWWYWKLISAPDPVSDTASISFIGSYC